MMDKLASKVIQKPPSEKIEMPSRERREKLFGDRIIFAQARTHHFLAVTDQELQMITEQVANGRNPSNPSSMHTDEFDEQARLGGQVIFAMLTKRGCDVERDDCENIALLSQFRPFGIMRGFLDTLYRCPERIGFSQIDQLDKAIKGTEKWLMLLHQSKAFQAIAENPLEEKEFGEELRQLGATTNPKFANVALKNSILGHYKPLLPGANVAISLEDLVDFYLDVGSAANGAPRCDGMRQFLDIMQTLSTNGSTLAKKTVGKAIQRELSQLIDSVVNSVVDPEMKAAAHLMFLRDGVLRLCNQRLSTLYESAKKLPVNNRADKIIELLSSAPIDLEQKIIKKAPDIARIIEKKGCFEFLEKVLPEIPLEEREALIDLLATATDLIESIDILSKKGMKIDSSTTVYKLAKPLPFAENGDSVAQLIAQTLKTGKENKAKLLLAYVDLLTENLSLRENHTRGSALLNSLFSANDGAKHSDLNALFKVARAAFDDYSESRTFGIELDADSHLLPNQFSWALEFLESEKAKEQFMQDFESHGAKSWFKKLLLTQSSRISYFSSLNSDQQDERQKCLNAAKGEEPENKANPSTRQSAPKSKKALHEYKKIVFVGGLQNSERENEIKELLPKGTDVRFYYANTGSDAFNNLNATTLANGPTLLVCLTNFVSHAVTDNAKKLAKTAKADFVHIPKHVQNPNVILIKLNEFVYQSNS